MTQIVRFLGLQALAQLSSRLPRWLGWLVSLAIMVVVNAAPLLTLREGSWGVTDVILFYAIENVLLFVVTLVRVLTFDGGPEPGIMPSRATWLTGSKFTALVFGGLSVIWVIAGVVMAVVLAVWRGLDGSVGSWVLNVVLLAVGYLGTLAIFWFGQRQRLTVHSPAFMVAAAPVRMALLHVAALVLLNSEWPTAPVPRIIWIMVAVKVVYDLGLMVIQLFVRPGQREGEPVAAN